MDTIEGKLKDRLVANGMFPEQAQAVIDMAKNRTDLFPDMESRWADEVEGYPQQAIAVLWFGIKHIALEWIDANLPQAWYRPLFSGEETATLK